MTLETLLLAAVLLLLLHVLSRLARIESAVRDIAGPTCIDLSVEPSGEVVALAQAHKKIEAMRLYRQQSGADLKEAKRVVEQLLAAAAA